MTREEAIHRLEGGAPFSELYDEVWENALVMAIEALKSEPIVHCKDCKYHEDEELGMVWCPFFIGSWVENDFHCAIGEKREETMTDKELFEEVFNRFVERYNIIVERPYNNNYVVLKLRSGYVIGEFNYDGYNLLYNLDRLCKVFEYEMR